MQCPCGDDHDVSPWLEALMAKGGETVRIGVTGCGTWMIPRVFIQQHGVSAGDFPLAAEVYGFESVPPRPGDFTLTRGAGE